MIWGAILGAFLAVLWLEWFLMALLVAEHSRRLRLEIGKQGRELETTRITLEAVAAALDAVQQAEARKPSRPEGGANG
ncbi:MAG: hypothetical protein A2286_02515 [Gammaproteobacteria bacterium RIFOXYA12_FULL_61_12]|nr:MAG: hypothetical protein A2286_02515 [Gammaproteobacteria bacterium RIFOXYA12_FULL_61_12]